MSDCEKYLSDPGTDELTERECGDEGELCGPCMQKELDYWNAAIGPQVRREYEERKFYEEYGHPRGECWVEGFNTPYKVEY